MEDLDSFDYSGGDDSFDVGSSDTESSDTADFSASDEIDTESIDTDSEIETLDFSDDDPIDTADDIADAAVPQMQEAVFLKDLRHFASSFQKGGFRRITSSAIRPL